MLKVELVDQKNVSWRAAYESSLVLNDGFRNDFMRHEYWSAKYDFSSLPKVGYDQLVKIRPFRIAVDHFARFLVMKIRQNPRYRLLLYKDRDGVPVGMATFILPSYVTVPEPSLLYRLKTCFLSIVYKVQNWWDFKGFANPLHPPEMAAEFETGQDQCTSPATPERFEELSSHSYDELAKEAYPGSWSYYLSLLSVADNKQGQGLGKVILDEVLSILKTEFGIQKPHFGGPAKMELFSSPAGVNFYKRYGFTLASSYLSTQPSGRPLTHSFFYMNLD